MIASNNALILELVPRHDMSILRAHPYERLTPDCVAAAVESQGFATDGRMLALNSYENRVYQVGLEEAAPIIAKFYRPGRWSLAAIQEEHDFAAELQRAEIPVVAPLRRDQRSLFEHEGFHFALFERQGGRWPELANKEDRLQMGRFLGRLHQVGRRLRFRHRSQLSVRQFAQEPRRFLLDEAWIPDHLLDAYASISAELIHCLQARLNDDIDLAVIRLHGDCHPGNILWTDKGPHFVDLDDCLQGPAIQDLWMLISGNRAEMSQQLGELLEGYTQFADFDYRELGLIEVLRTLRIMNYAAWLARRWSDPAFPRAFPWFGETKFWEQHVLDLREQRAALDEEPLVLT